MDATQELIALGMSNIANSFVKAFPGSGSLSRSAVNNASGVRTPLGGLYTGRNRQHKLLRIKRNVIVNKEMFVTGILVVLALFFLTPYFAFIPKATLAAIIIAAVIFMVEVKVVRPMWRTKSMFVYQHMCAFRMHNNILTADLAYL